jgi:hypothetical protein
MIDLEKGWSDSGEVYWRLGGRHSGMFVVYLWDGVDV